MIITKRKIYRVGDYLCITLPHYFIKSNMLSASDCVKVTEKGEIVTISPLDYVPKKIVDDEITKPKIIDKRWLKKNGYKENEKKERFELDDN